MSASAVVLGALKWAWMAIAGAFKWIFSDLRHVAIVLLTAAGLHMALVRIPGLKERLDDALASLAASRAAHVRTITEYRNAQAEATRQAAENLARVKAEQDAETRRIVDGYEKRIADARSRAAALVRMRAQVAGAGAAGGATPAGVSGPGDAAAGADAAADDRGFPAWRVTAGRTDCPADRVCLTFEEALTATEQSIQLDELISWVEAQARIAMSPLRDGGDDAGQ